MTTGTLSPTPILQFFGNDGEPLSGGSILTQVGGINQATYQDSGLTTPLPNPIPLNSRGEISSSAGASQQLFLTPGIVYTFTAYDANGNQIWVASSVSGPAITQASIGALLYPVLTVESTWVVNVWYPYGDPRRYGAATTNGDNAAAINNCLATGLAVNGQGIQYLVGSTVTCNTPNQPIENLSLLANQSFPTTATGNYSTQSVFYVGALASVELITNLMIDGGLNASTHLSIAPYGCSVGAGSGRLGFVAIKHCSNFCLGFISSVAGDTGCIGYQIEQYDLNNDQAALTQTNFTASGIYWNRPDCFAVAGEGSYIRWCKAPLDFGPASQTSFSVNSHPYNGSYAGNPLGASPQVDPTIIRVQTGGSSINLFNTYADSGHVDLFESDVHFIGAQPLQNITGCLFADPNWIRLYSKGHGYPYDLDIDIPTAYLAGVGQNMPQSALATSLIGFYPSTPVNIGSLSSNGTTATLTYTAPSPYPPQINGVFVLSGVSPSSFNNSVTAGSFVVGSVYQIISIGTTDFTAIGAAANIVGQQFTAQGVGTGTGTAALVYTIASASQSGGVGSTVTITFLCTVNATGTGGTIQSVWAGFTTGLDAASGILGNGAHQRFRANGGEVLAALANTGAAQTIWATASIFTLRRQCGNMFPNVWQYGNQAYTYPYVNLTTGYFNLIAANYTASGPYPGVFQGFNLAGTGVGDDGSTNGRVTLRTQAAARVLIDGFSTGVQSMYPSVDNYMNLGYTTGSNHRWATVYAATGSINTSDAREKTDIEDADLGLDFVLKLRPVKYRWKVGGNHVEHGKYVFQHTGEAAPADWDPMINHRAQEALREKIGKMPKGNKISTEDRAALAIEESKLDALVKLAQSITRTPEMITPIPGKRTHYGLLAQEAKAALDAHGIKDHAGFVLADPNDPDSQQSLRYEELTIPALIKAVQELTDKIQQLEARMPK